MHHFLDVRRVLTDCRRAVGMAHVQRPESESSRSDPQFISEGLVPARPRGSAGPSGPTPASCPSNSQDVYRDTISMKLPVGVVQFKDNILKP